jgi:L-ascorbate metabolism protein UlaG (beta-lactamase superfamily)
VSRIQFGGKITQELLERYALSPNWRDGSFQNLEATTMSMSPFKIPQIIYKQFTNRADKAPKVPLPIAPLDVAAFLAPSTRGKFVWYGHSVVLMRMLGKTLLIDPMFGPDAAPIAPFAAKRFSENTLDLIDQLPEIDLVLLTHDHYDHLDYASIQKLAGKVKQYFVALGVKRHLVRWGIPDELITEFDWWDQQTFGEMVIHYTPTRHFSGRGLTDRMKSLWGGWVFHLPEEKIWFSGDGGYGQHFKEIGQRLGPFDFAFMENGQYNEDWRPIHLFPDECVQAAIDAKVKKAMPVHWAGFALSYQHRWFEPAVAFKQFAETRGLDYALPTLGTIFSAADVLQEAWWEAYR